MCLSSSLTLSFLPLRLVALVNFPLNFPLFSFRIWHTHTLSHCEGVVYQLVYQLCELFYLPPQRLEDCILLSHRKQQWLELPYDCVQNPLEQSPLDGRKTFAFFS